MKKRKPTKEDVRYLQDTLYVIGGKWRFLIMLSLAQGNNRFSDLKRSIAGITARTLSRELKALELNGIVIREMNNHDNTPDYNITIYCNSFDPVIQSMIDWGKQHRQNLKEAAKRTAAAKALSQPALTRTKKPR
ncbi:helix-turn-helix domain-containing protein [Pseudoflavitalea sp. G-6-1-2]|uniref:winged helix-turn-helix transcriptional regulator n=1 Tax=Pseudoflavitalea sp. G-6-1-2 TaxID=2728841 RepID=UPI00197E6A67|nr:helix-turn-helix domain-containing protein [Pseudoflavitalea sp. G-6-1-2]